MTTAESTEPEPERTAQDPQTSDEVWVIESWASLKGDNCRAVKLFVKMDHEPDANDKVKLRSKASGSFRHLYGAWADTLGEKTYQVHPPADV